MRAFGRSATVAAGLALAAGAGACDPQPRFPANDPALAALDATVIYERELVADGVAHLLEIYPADFVVPADVAPLGTRFTVRLVKGATLTPVVAADLQWSVGGPSTVAALITPETITFTSPIRLATLGFPNGIASDVYVLHARSTDTAWTRGDTLTPSLYTPAVVEVDGGGLWSVAYQRVPPP